MDKPVFPFHSIYPRQEESIFRLTEHLIRGHGCKKLYCITGYPNEPHSDERAAGFCRAMQMNGIPYSTGDIFYGHFWMDIPREIGKQIADGTLKKPDGIVCASDVMAAALCESLTANGVRVPADICVTSYDGSWDAWMHFPRITTITGRDRQFGEDAMLRLAEMITGTPQGFSSVMQEIRYGDSCGCKHLHAQTESVDQLVAERCFIQTILRSRQKKTNYTSDLIDRLRGASTLEEWITAVDRVGHILLDWKWLDLCLCADWCMEFEHPELRRRSGFSDEMILAFSKRRDHNEERCSFPTGDILPALSQPHEPHFLLLTSLHAKGQIFGYLAAAYDSPDDIGLDEYFINWCDAAANGLAGVQERMYLAYQKRQISLLTIHDPETGLYNRRGLAELLPQSLKNAKQLLTYTDLRIHEIADQCGYQNESHFMRQFKEKIGKTALQYRADTKK